MERKNKDEILFVFRKRHWNSNLLPNQGRVFRHSKDNGKDTYDSDKRTRQVVSADIAQHVIK
jgi:hypothetical protein